MTRPFSVFALLVVALLLGACAPLMSGDGAAPLAGVAPQQRPEQVVASFLDAWSERDLDAMYGLISPQSRQLYRREQFEQIVSSANNLIGLEGLSYNIGGQRMQGSSVAINYDLTIQSASFGQIDDPGRTIRLVDGNEGWRVAWSTMDIFEGLTASASMTVDEVPQQRANIYDRNGNLLVEQNGTVSPLFVTKDNIPGDVNDCIIFLADLLLMRRRDLAETFNRNNFDTLFYAGEIDEELEVRYRAELRDICGMTRDNQRIYTRTARRYYGQGASVHATGYVAPIPEDRLDVFLSRGYAQDALVGQTGVEEAYDSTLAGRPARELRIIEPGGSVLRSLAGADGISPQSVTLTIDRDLQWAAARALAEAYNYAEINWAAPGISPGGGAIVMDANTGAVLALASFPTFQPGLFDSTNTFAENRGALLGEIVNDPTAPLTNRVTRERFSSGSVFKIVTTTAIANEGLIGPNQSFYCGLEWDGSQTYGDTTSPRFDWRQADGLPPTGEIDIALALTTSCDPFYYEYSARMYRDLGAETLLSYARMMGYQGRTSLSGILPEAEPQLPVPGSVEAAINSAIGQGDTQVTVVQTAVMVAAVANGGDVLDPYMVQQVGGVGGEPLEFMAEPTVVRTLDVSSEVLQIVREGMCDVTKLEEYGTAYSVFGAAPYEVCGKTGTAEAGPVAPNSWFVAYHPRVDPEIVVVVMSQNSREGSEVAAPIARRIIEEYLGLDFRSEWPEWWIDPYEPLTRPGEGVPLGG